MNHTDSNVVLAQRYAYATVALVVGLLSFVNLFGFEKSILAVVLGLKALGKEPAPALDARRHWAKSGVALGIASDRAGGDHHRVEPRPDSEADCDLPGVVGRMVTRW